MATRTVIDMDAVDALLQEPAARSAVDDAAAQFVDTARGLAAHRTGAGSASIHADIGDGNEADVSWDQQHYYMYFVEFGTKFMAPHPALQAALDRYAQF